MRKLRRRPLVLVALVLLVPAALVGILFLVDAWRTDRALDAELAALHAGGFLPVAPEDEPSELRAARERLADLLLRIERADTIEDGVAFGAPGMLDAADPEAGSRIVDGLRERADLVAGLEALPGVLWDAAGESFEDPRRWLTPERRPPGDSLAALRATTNLMCAVAWTRARDPHGGAEAGRWLARSVALARVTDGGDLFELALRSAMEGIALDCLEGLRAEGIVDPAVLEAPVREELARIDEVARLRLALRCDLARYEALLELVDRPFGLPTGSRFLLDEVRWRRELLEAGFPDGWRERDRPERWPVGGEEAWLARVAATLASRDTVRARVLDGG